MERKPGINMTRQHISREEFEKMSPEDRQAVMLNSRAQMILDLIQAAALPLDLGTLAAMQLAMERIGSALEEAMEEIGEEKRKVHELYLASNMAEAARGGSKKVIFDGKG